MGQQDPEDLLQQADVAMYSAKESGRDTTQLFLPSMQAAVDERLKIERGSAPRTRPRRTRAVLPATGGRRRKAHRCRGFGALEAS